MAKDKIVPSYMSLKDAAKYTGISARTWYWLWANRPDAPRRIQVGGPGGKILVSKTDIDNFLDRQKQEPGALVGGIVKEVLEDFGRKAHEN